MSLPTLIVELDLGDPTGTPTWSADITSYVRAWSSTRGSQRELQRVEAGTASILLDNRTGRFSPSSTTSVFYPNLLPMRRVRIRATWNAVIYPVFSGFVESWGMSFPAVGADQVVQIPLVDGFKVLSLATVNSAFSAQLSGARVGAVLDAISWPAADRDIDAGNSIIPAATLANTSALEHLQAVEHAEGGKLFMTRDGKVRFKNRYDLTTPDFGGRTWADNGTAMSYRDLTPHFGDDLLINEARLTRDGGAEQTASDSASQTKYYRRSLVESGILLSSDAEVSDLAQDLVAKYKDPVQRIERIEDNAMRHSLWNQLLGRELRDRVLVIKTPTGASTISQDSYIEGISHDWAVDQWRTSVSVSPASGESFWILDDPVYSVLDSTTRLAR